MMTIICLTAAAVQDSPVQSQSSPVQSSPVMLESCLFSVTVKCFGGQFNLSSSE